jgi:thioredoxin-like negative regulator of GroEL
MVLQIAPERAVSGETEMLLRQGTPLIIEFTSSRAKQRPLAARAGGIEILPGGRMPVRAVDIDRYPDLRKRFRINLLPTFIVMQDLNEIARFIGPHSRRELTGALRRALDPAVVKLEEPPKARAKWNDFTVRLWGFST